jgi:hypothetical protein
VQAQNTLDALPVLAPLVIEQAARRLCIGEVEIHLEPMELVFYVQLAQAKVERVGRGDGFLGLTELDGLRGAMLRRYERLYPPYSGHVENLRQAWKEGIPPERLRSIRANINRKIRQAIPDTAQAEFYAVTSERHYAATRYGLLLAAERIELRE